MLHFIASRMVQAATALLALSAFAFVMSHATGNPLDLMLPATATKEDYAHASRALGLDKPLVVQYEIYLRNALHGDLGNSIQSGESVTAILGERLGASAELAFVSLVLTFAVGIPIGVLSAIRRGGIVDAVVKTIALIGQSAPAFWLGIVLIQVFAVWLRWLPAGTAADPRGVILPAVTLALFGIAGVVRLLRSSMLEILDSDFVKMARAKGLPERSVVGKHALKNSMLPTVSFSGIFIVNLVSLAVVTETVFAWPGLGNLAYTSILSRDFPVIQGVVLLAGAVSIVASAVTDVVYYYLDPRIRAGS